MFDTTLARYENQDGARQVALRVHRDLERPFAIADLPAEGFGALGTHFMLGTYDTREEAEEAADRHTAICVDEGTYEAWGVHHLVRGLDP